MNYAVCIKMYPLPFRTEGSLSVFLKPRCERLLLRRRRKKSLLPDPDPALPLHQAKTLLQICASPISLIPTIHPQA